VVFAVFASYLLSRTLVPTLVMWFEDHHQRAHAAGEKPAAAWARPFVAVQQGFERGFERFRDLYRDVLSTLLNHRKPFVLVFLGFCASSLVLIPFLGRDFFPTVDAGAFRLHVRAQTGTRIEETAKLIDEVEKAIREVIPARELKGILDNIGLPVSGINLSYSDSGTTGSAAATSWSR
jgi:multidrug efflux pump subunit AcrB